MVFSGFFEEPRRSRPTFTAKEKEALFRSPKGACPGCGDKVPIATVLIVKRN